MPEKIVAALLFSLLAGAMIASHINQCKRLELARIEEQRLDMAGLVGWVQYDPDEMRFVYTERR